MGRTTGVVNTKLVDVAVGLSNQAKRAREKADGYDAKLVPLMRRMRKAELVLYLRRTR